MNQLQTTEPKERFSLALKRPNMQALIASTLTDPKRAQRFIATITSAVAQNPALQECTPVSVISSALVGEALQLSPSAQLGQFYMVPFNVKAKQGVPEHKAAQFQIGYKGYLQLAIRTGQYKRINVLAVKAGELIHFDPLTEELKIEPIEDDEQRSLAPTVGYYATFEYLNGFQKSLYWSHKKMLSHADKYAPAFKAKDYERLQNGQIAESDKWKYSSFWYKSFDDMALKTMIRQLLSKWGVMSVDMQSAIEKDMGVIDETGNAQFFDNEPEQPPVIQMPQAEHPLEPQGGQPAAAQPPAQPQQQEPELEPHQASLRSKVRLKKLDIAGLCEQAGITFNGYENLTVDQAIAINDAMSLPGEAK